MEKKIYKIDATGQKMGRLATKAASLLIGKNLVDYAKNKVFNVEVIIENASKIDIFEGKLKTVYKKYSGFPGGLYEKSLEQMIDKKGKGGLLKIAILGMIPHNKLKSRIIRNLVIKE
jgi:large subunit ribosomal protein L13